MDFRSTILGLGLAATLAASAGACQKTQSVSKSRTVPKTSVRWKGVLMTGDDSIVAFDNARHALKSLWVQRGLAAKDIRELSMAPSEQKGSVLATSERNLERALKSLKLKDGDGCLIHMTSHGAPWGLYLRDQDALAPTRLDALLDKYCGKRPTVVFVSACYSGVFAGNVLKQPNRAIFTAARDDRNSFGCGVENVYTFWDGCAIEQLPVAKSWTALKRGLERCIRAKEDETQLRYSYPQAYIGTGVAKLPVLGRKATP
jgi:hypothetical protein